MYRILFRNTVTLCGAVIAPEIDNVVPAPYKEDFNVKWKRVKNIFSFNEFGELSPQLNTILQTTVMTGFFGSFYGGFINCREAYFRFIERNEATKFLDPFDAKRKLQTSVTLAFGRGALKWGWRLALFSSFYISFVTLLDVYRGSSSILDYAIAGTLSGVIYRIHMGVRAMIVSGTLGGMMGLFAGSMSMLILSLTGSTLDDIHQITSEMTAQRDRHFAEAAKKSREKDQQTVVADAHDSFVEKLKKPTESQRT